MIAVGSYSPGVDMTGRFRYLIRENFFYEIFFLFFYKPVNVVSYEWKVEEYCEPLASKEEQNIDQHMENILRQHKRVQTVALINGVLVIGF